MLTRGQQLSADRPAERHKTQSAVCRPLRWSWSRKLCRRISETLVVRSGGGEGRANNPEKADRGQRSLGLSAAYVFIRQATAVPASSTQLVLTATAREGQDPWTFNISVNETVPLDADTTVRLAEFIPDYVATGWSCVRTLERAGKSSSALRRGIQEIRSIAKCLGRFGLGRRRCLALYLPRQGCADGLLHRPIGFA